MENKKNMDYILNTAKLISNEEVEVEKYLKAYKVFQNGSTWLKADFHMHTKADSEFKYQGNQFIQDYIKALKKAEIRLGVITNHNKFDLVEFKSLRKEALKEEIYLLPGVEFSIRDGAHGIHLLIVFSDEWIYNGENKNYLQDFLISAFVGIGNYNSPPYPNSQFDLNETYKILNAFQKDYFFILAHVDEKNGLFKELSGRNLEQFVKQESFNKVLAVQKSGNLNNYNILNKLCKNTVIEKKIACVEGTDNTQNGLNAIVNNQRKCYLKIGDFNFDAVKFALFANDGRVVLREKPKINNAFIKSISFEGGLLNGQTIDFSSELNNLIGIRGSGKSAIIETIRYSLNIPFTSTTVDKEYKNSLVQYVLGSGGKAVFTIVNKYGQEYRAEKIFGQKEDIYKNGILQTGVDVNAIIENPVYFGQKDLSSKDADFESDFIKRLIGNKLDVIQKDIERKKQEIKEIVFQLNRTKNISDQKKEIQTVINNTNHQLGIFKQYGIEEKLKTQTLYEKDLSTLNASKEEINNFIRDLEDILNSNKGLFEKTPEISDINKTYGEEIRQIFGSFNDEFKNLSAAVRNLNNFVNKFIEIINKINSDKEKLKEEFAKIKREINIPNINPDQFIELNRIIQTNQLKLNELEKLEKQKNELDKLLQAKLVELNNLWHNEYKILNDEISRINQNHDKLTIEIEYKGRREKFIKALKRYFTGCNIRENAYQDISERYRDFAEIYKEGSKIKELLNTNQLAEFEKHFNENLFDLLIFRVEDKITIKYNGKELSKHSLGQRASALILFLLLQKGQNILIIDQPEDDLDNQTIYNEVIREILKLKGQMQFIFATHNANIPVLGDSEKIVACEYEENKITIKQGSIDTPNIQKAIVNIMEGGLEAFNRRKKIYNIWKTSNERQG